MQLFFNWVAQSRDRLRSKFMKTTVVKKRKKKGKKPGMPGNTHSPPTPPGHCCLFRYTSSCGCCYELLRQEHCALVSVSRHSSHFVDTNDCQEHTQASLGSTKCRALRKEKEREGGGAASLLPKKERVGSVIVSVSAQPQVLRTSC